MVYKRYEAEAAKDYTACPYCLKLSNRRWYVLMKTDRNYLQLFSLDRIKFLELLPKKFTIPFDFNAAAFFSECFGVVVGDGTKAEVIRLRALFLREFAQ